MALKQAIKCKHCGETHTLSEGCGGGIARKRAQLEAQTRERYEKPVTPVTKPVTRYEKPVTQALVSEPPPNLPQSPVKPPPVAAPTPSQASQVRESSVPSKRGPAPQYASRADRQRAYRERKRQP